ncbi:hypothetical protein AAG570_000405 [Ranatra chinensis]|uniref:Uncharacterized protein n=1 Tax=Ranatra chinensis TaxID=642074 RepID=A0ABD0ZDV0_9HEMI
MNLAKKFSKQLLLYYMAHPWVTVINVVQNSPEAFEVEERDLGGRPLRFPTWVNAPDLPSPGPPPSPGPRHPSDWGTCQIYLHHCRAPAPHETALHETAPHDNVPHSTATHDTALHYTSPHDTALLDTALHDTSPHRTARTALHRTSRHCNS